VIFIIHIMKICYYAFVFVGLVFLASCISGCVTPQSTSGGPQLPVESTYTLAKTTSPPLTGSPGATTTIGGIVDTTINIHFNDYDCLDIQERLGVVYLNAGEKYSIRVSPPGNPVNVNLLLLDVGDKERIQVVKPEWNTVTKTWDYAGIVPLVQFNDVSVTAEKTVTIKNQGKYYLCADDRKESGINDAIIRVPVRVTRLW
jgi:hypothetical protein